MEMPKLKATGRSRQRRINQLFLQVKWNKNFVICL
jgi:hypothetical protein